VDKGYQVLGTLTHLDRVLPPEEFIRIHRSFLVRLDQVTSFDTRHAWVAGQRIPIGDAYRSKLNRFMLFPASAVQSAPPSKRRHRATQPPE